VEKSQLIVNGVFYFFLTAFFIMLWINEKKIVACIKEKRDIFSDWLIEKFGIKSSGSQKALKKTINLTESLGTAVILVLIIQRFYVGNFLVPTGSMIPTIMPKDRLFGNMFIYKFRRPKREEIIVFKEPIQNKVLYTKRLMGLPGETIKIEPDSFVGVQTDTNARIYDGYLIANDKMVTKERLYFTLGELAEDSWYIPKKGDSLKIVPGEEFSQSYKEQNIDIATIQKKMFEEGSASELPDVEFFVNGKKTGPILDYLHNNEILAKLVNGEQVETTIEENYYLALGDNTASSYDSRMWGFVAESRIRGKALVKFWPLTRIGILK